MVPCSQRQAHTVPTQDRFFQAPCEKTPEGPTSGPFRQQNPDTSTEFSEGSHSPSSVTSRGKMSGCAGSKRIHCIFLTTRDQNQCQAALGRLRRKQAAASLGSPGQPGLWPQWSWARCPHPVPFQENWDNCSVLCHEGSQGAKSSFSVGLVDRALLSALNLTSVDQRPRSDTDLPRRGQQQSESRGMSFAA